MTDRTPPANRKLIFIACLISTFTAAIEATIVATALPSIVADLGGFSLFGWVFCAYFLPQVVTIPIYGRLADLYGRKPIFFLATGLFLIGSVLCGLAWSMPALIAFRAAQGLGAGGILPLTQTIVGDLYKPSERGQIQGWLSSVWGVSAIVGPALGAFIVVHLDWSLVFWINLPLGAAALILLGLLLHEERHPVAHTLDLVGALLLTVATVSLMLALLQADELGGLAWPLGLFGVAMGVVLIGQQRRAREPVLPLVLWRDPTIVAGNLGSLAGGAMMMGIIGFLPTYLQAVLGCDPITAGLALTLMTLGWPLGAMASARLIMRTSYRTSAGLGGFCMVAGAATLLTLEPVHGLSIASIGATLIGMGLGFTNTAFLISTQEAAGRHRRGAATSSIIFMRTIGQSLGTALMGAVLNLGLAHRLPGIGDAVQTLMDPVRRGGLAGGQRGLLEAAVGGALHEVYLVVLLIAVAALALAWQVPSGLRPVPGE